MTVLTCPKCRQGMPDDALDAGQCPQCGFPLDGPVVLGGHAPRGGRRIGVAAVVLVLAGTGAALAGRALLTERQSMTALPPAVVGPVPAGTTPHVAPPPREVVRPVPPDSPPPVPPSKPVGPRPVGVVMRVDPRVEPNRHFDHPDDTAALPDLNGGDRVKLTGRVRVLRLGSVRGKAAVDASGLLAEEVVITGDLDGDAVVTLNAPNGSVTVGGYVVGSARLVVSAPGGVVSVADSGRVTGAAVVTVTARRLEVRCPISRGARVVATLTAGGSLRVARAEEGALVAYKKAAAADPPPAIELGQLTGGARVVEGN